MTSLHVDTGVQVYLPIRQQTLTAHVDMRLVPCKDVPGFAFGTVQYKRNGVVFATSGLESTGLGMVLIPVDLSPGPTTFTAEFTNADRSQQPSASEPLIYRTALVTPTVAVSARGVTLSAADQKKFGVTSGLIVTSTVKAPGSTYVPTGKVHVNVRGKVTTVMLVGGRAVSTVIPAARGTVTIFSTFEPTGDPALAIRALGRVNATVIR